MASLTEDLRSEIQGLFNAITTTAVEQTFGSDVPLIGSSIQDALGASVLAFSPIQTAIFSALEDVDDAASAQSLAEALDAIDGVDATASDGKVLITIGASDVLAASDAFMLAVGTSALGISLGGEVGYDIEAALDIKLSFDAEGTHELTVIDDAGDELSLSINGSLTNLAGEGNLGFLGIKATDTLATPEIALHAAVNITGDTSVDMLTAASFATSIGGDANLNLALETDLSTDLLPKLFSDFLVQYHIEDFDPASGLSGLGATPTIQFDNIELDLGSLVDFLASVFDPIISDVFGEFPLGDLIRRGNDPAAAHQRRPQRPGPDLPVRPGR